MDEIKKRKSLLGLGISFFSCGIVFTAVGVSAQPILLGMGPAFFAIGVIFIALSRHA